jgi:hypothetical protein
MLYKVHLNEQCCACFAPNTHIGGGSSAAILNRSYDDEGGSLSRGAAQMLYFDPSSLIQSKLVCGGNECGATRALASPP